MNWNFSAWSIRNPVPPILLFSVLVILGWVSFVTLPITKFPNIDIPLVMVNITDQGSAPSELESQITKKVEDAIAGITGVDHMQSDVSDSVSRTVVRFKIEINSDRALNDVKDAITKIRADLPRTINEPIVQRLDAESQPIITYGIGSLGMTPEQLSWFVDDTVLRQIQGLAGVGRAERIGGQTREIHVLLKADRLMALGISAADVNAQLRATSLDESGGKGQIAGSEQMIRMLARATTIAELGATKIAISGGRQVRLDDIAELSDGWQEPVSFARLDSKPVVTMTVYRANGASDVSVAATVDAKIADLAKQYPDVSFSKIDDSVYSTYSSYSNAMHSLIEGGLLAVAVVFLFLRDFRATIVAAIAMPLAAIPTFWAISVAGFSLNMVSLLAITLVTGILVDDAIVEIENIVRHMQMGKSPYRAAMEAADEIGLAVIAISFTIIAVFVPVSFMGGIVGQYFKQFGLTVAIAVFISLMVARLITPMMAAYLFRSHGHANKTEGWIIRSYTGVLKGTLKWRWLTFAGGVVFAVLAIKSAVYLPQGFMPPDDQSRLVASFELPPGVSLDETARVTDKVTRTLKTIPEVKDVFVLGGTSPTGTLELRRARIAVHLVHKAERTRSQKQVEGDVTRLLSTIPDIVFYMVNDRGQREFTMNIEGSDISKVNQAAFDLQRAMANSPIFDHPSAAASYDRPELRIVPKLDVAADLGITPDAISNAIRVATTGDFDANLPKFKLGIRQIPIRVQIDTAIRQDAAALAAIRVPTAKGKSVPLEAVADIRYGVGPSAISRWDREDRVEVGSAMAPGHATGEAAQFVEQYLKTHPMPAGVHPENSGDTEIQHDLFASFGKAMGAGVMMVFVVLILLLGNIFRPITILATLPLSVAGVVLALLATHNPVSMPVIIGVLMLMGIVTKNGIMLVDFAVEREKHGMSQHDAIIDAGRKRARPIVMTTIAMVAGMAPAAIGAGEGGEFRSPMAIAVIGGLLVSTVLSLVFIPSFYTIMDDLGRLVGKVLGWAIRPNIVDEDQVVVAGRHGEASHSAGHAPAAAELGLPGQRLHLVSAAAHEKARRPGPTTDGDLAEAAE
ncbi:MAG: efflux RND transporter permease subunit [Ancalomicrobiaceae bacterium]|nr:efflux RND transporter permease subunit [Ancalomicrobiaceae bacterium]